MEILDIRATGVAGIRVIVSEALPNGDKFLDLYVHYRPSNQNNQVDSAKIVKELLSNLVPAY